MILYYLVVPFLYLLSYLPSSVLYKLANVLSFTLRAVIGYRKKVVYQNIRNAFPDKTESEINSIAKESYTHLADRVVENIKCVTISKEEIQQKVIAENLELLNEYYAKGRNVVLMVGHIASWEYGGYKLSINCKHWIFGIVSLVSNKKFNELIQRTRGKMGMHLIPMKDAKDFFKQDLKQLSLGIFISDQSPSNKERAYWTSFLNQDTAFFTGAERYARKHNCVVMYPKIVQKERGAYHAVIIPISENPREEKENAITEKFVRLLEQQIIEHPSDWLWSHKRWKHKKGAGN